MRHALSHYCAVLGKDPLLVQGPGGNASWKEKNTLWVKASGTWLAEAEEKDIFVPVDLKHLQEAIANGNFLVTPNVLGEHRLRPSIETILHALMPHDVVMHLHAVDVMATLVRENVKERLNACVEANIAWVSVAYHKPGAPLAEAIAIALQKKPEASVVFLENHGVVIGGKTVEEIDGTLKKLQAQLQVPVQDFPVPSPSQKLFEGYKPIQDSLLNQLATVPELYNRLSQDWALYPDHVVFLGAKPVCVNAHAFPDVSENPPLLVFVEGEGIWVSEKFSAVHTLQLRCYYDVLVRQPFHISLHSLTYEQIGELLNWDAEHYRQQLST